MIQNTKYTILNTTYNNYNTILTIPTILTSSKNRFFPFFAVCKDNNVKCPFWASAGECTRDRVWMLPNCRKSCNQCGGRFSRPLGNGGIFPRLPVPRCA